MPMWPNIRQVPVKPCNAIVQLPRKTISCVLWPGTWHLNCTSSPCHDGQSCRIASRHVVFEGENTNAGVCEPQCKPRVFPGMPRHVVRSGRGVVISMKSGPACHGYLTGRKARCASPMKTEEPQDRPRSLSEYCLSMAGFE